MLGLTMRVNLLIMKSSSGLLNLKTNKIWNTCENNFIWSTIYEHRRGKMSLSLTVRTEPGQSQNWNQSKLFCETLIVSYYIYLYIPVHSIYQINYKLKYLEQTNLWQYFLKIKKIIALSKKNLSGSFITKCSQNQS